MKIRANQIADDNIKDYHIAWGSGSGQVDVADIPISETDANNFEGILGTDDVNLLSALQTIDVHEHDNVSILGPGYAPQAPGAVSQWLRGDGQWASLSGIPDVPIYTTTASDGEGYYRIATIPISTNCKQATFRVKAYTAAGITTELTATVNIAYLASTVASSAPGISANVSHSYNAWTSADSGYTLLYIRVSYNTTEAYIDLYTYKSGAITIETSPLLDNDWVWATGALTKNPTVGSSLSSQCALRPGNVSNAGYISEAGSTVFSYGGVWGGGTISNNMDNSGKWAYVGYLTMGYSASYLGGMAANIAVRMVEVTPSGIVAPADLEDFEMRLKVTVPAFANSTEFNAAVPSIAIDMNGKTSLDPTTDVAAAVYASSTSSKVIRLYIKLKSANTQYMTLPQNRFGRIYSTVFARYDWNVYFTYADVQAVITAAQLASVPVQGSVVYGTARQIDHGSLSGILDDDHTQYHNDTRGDARYSLLAHAHDGTYAPAASGVLNGNSHDHVGGDGASIVGIVPVGGVIAYIPGYFGDGSNGSYSGVVLTLPSEWIYLSGQVVNDSDSPIYNGAGRYAPNISDSRFLMGSTSPGSTGGANSITLTSGNVPEHYHSINHDHSSATSSSDGSHNHGGTSGNESSHTHDYTHTHGLNNFATATNVNQTGAGSKYYPSTGTETTDSQSATTTGAGSSHNHSISSAGAHTHTVDLDNYTGNSGNYGSASPTALENRPLYLTCYYIQRIK